MTPKKVRVFVSRVLQEQRKTNTYLDQVLKDFALYKGGQVIAYFGRDVPYHDPRPYAERAGIRHVHLLSGIRTVRMRSDTSDRALVYTEGASHPDTYYIIDLLVSQAHAKASSRVPDPGLGNKTYIEWVIDKAEAFRDRF